MLFAPKSHPTPTSMQKKQGKAKKQIWCSSSDDENKVSDVRTAKTTTTPAAKTTGQPNKDTVPSGCTGESHISAQVPLREYTVSTSAIENQHAHKQQPVQDGGPTVAQGGVSINSRLEAQKEALRAWLSKRVKAETGAFFC